jgi:hypothetical protein
MLLEIARADALKASDNRELEVNLSAVQLNEMKLALEKAQKQNRKNDGGGSKLSDAAENRMVTHMDKVKLENDIVDLKKTIDNISDLIKKRKMR